METTNKKTSFKQYKYCSLCKINHRKGKKHIYSKKHQLFLKNSIKKFTLKIQTVKKTLFGPELQDETHEPDAKFWCYFCAEEFNKHTIIDNCVVIGSGLLEHIASANHKTNMDSFFFENVLKKDLKSSFVLSVEDLSIFKKASLTAVKKRQKANDVQRKQLAEDMKMVEEKRHSRLMEVVKSECSVNTTSLHNLPASRNQSTSQGKASQTSVRGKRTVSAKAGGLACITKSTGDGDIQGNVHTGATPPWLQEDSSNCNSTQIGPTMEDFNKHLEQVKKSKLPANRVGASFDHTTATSSDWLPSFGRVWNKGRRLQSKIHFEKSWKKDKQNSPRIHTETLTSASNDAHSHHKHSSDWSNTISHSSDWSNSKSSANQQSDMPDPASSANHTSDWSTDSASTNHIAPYKRKRSSVESNEQSAYSNVNDTRSKDPKHGQGFVSADFNPQMLTPYRRRQVPPPSDTYNDGITSVHSKQPFVRQSYNASKSDDYSMVNNTATFDHTATLQETLPVPYKRRHKNGSNSTDQLIQTPVLFKHP